MSSITGSFGDESQLSGSTRPFDDDGYIGYEPRLSSQRFPSSFSNFDADSIKEFAGDSSPVFTSQSYSVGENFFSSNPVPDTPSPPSIYSSGLGFSTFSSEQNGKSFHGGLGGVDGSILPPPAEMPAEEGFALREWRRQNAIRLEEKEKKEKEMLQEIIEEAEQYKVGFYKKRALGMEKNKDSNREKEKLFLANREKFHAEALKNCWKAIAELIPYEVPAIEKRGKKDQEKKKPSIVVIQGPKPGKATDCSRLRQILTKLKHNPPAHMKPKPPPPSEPKREAKTGTPAAAAAPLKPAAAATTTPDAVAAA
ncbi:clathrin light chain 3-like [Mangifera indica]|uniref:clathrin light chain 3-like n=1 Tax=Mangifera indica TaxID=29780 RepID=UPI001CFB9F11|nr:clathrin light chain 3-like [Mangifera indica]